MRLCLPHSFIYTQSHENQRVLLGIFYHDFKNLQNFYGSWKRLNTGGWGGGYHCIDAKLVYTNQHI
jgi:hypothetical protein